MHEEFPTDEPAVVTCGLPYANGDLHVGHLRTYVSGDAFSRALDRVGQNVAFVSGSDMHGTPIAVNAAEEGVDPEEFALEYHEQYEETFPKFNVDFDNYGHTHDETNTEVTREFVRSWIDNDHIVEKEIEVAWDAEQDQPLPDRFVEGTCPYCGEKARGDECDEGCQRHLEPGEIEDPVSTITGNPAEYRTRPHKFLRLSDFQDYLQSFIDRLEGTENAQNQPREWIEGELEDLCITRDMDWGIDYPGEGEEAEDLVLYVWVDAPIEYVASTKQYSERVGTEEFDWEAAWKNQSDGTPPEGGEASDASRSSSGSGTVPDGGDIVHIIGHDIIQHHTVFWPSMLRGADYNEPRAVMACGFVNLAGKAFSTSRNRAVWADDYIEAGLHPDLYRYHIITGSEFTADVNFSWDGLQERVNSELVGTLGNFCYRSLLFAERNYDGTPDTDVSEEVRDRIEEAMAGFREAINDYRVRGLGRAPVELAKFGNEYIQQHEPWKLTDDDPQLAAQVIRDCVQISKAVAVLMEPVLPGKAEELWAQLGEDGSVHDAALGDALAAPPAEFGEPEELFEGLEDERVEELNEQLEASIAAAEAETESDEDAAAESDDMDIEPINDERVSFEEFQDLDLRVAEVLEAEPIEGADKLAKLQVDIGVEERQIVAGIKQLHDLDELPGTRIVVVANLEKNELFGVESNGMLLAAGEDADLLTTHGDSEPGTKVR
ncbi:methionine--tRNA ligase [Natronomonas halophila]|uniref:methionine--tRNA ligase n=1 Tax=Natronomonas halophila TaxID=2747817 RepID=UPI0015B59237|nr:methionine--tRNA ligase [Natronomonas halophila]QLD86458.1 methionine--tRNA ligase [Natronomonas halophila]